MRTDKIFDLFILLAKYLHAKTKTGNPSIQVFVGTVKLRSVVQKYNTVIMYHIAKFNKEWALYSHLFPRRILAICRFLRLIWLLSTRPLTSIFSFVLTFCLCVCLKRLYSIVAMCTGHGPVPSGAVDMTDRAMQPCKEAESVSECIVTGWMRAV